MLSALYANPYLLWAIVLMGLGLMAIAWSLLRDSSKKDEALKRIDEFLEDRRRIQMTTGSRNQVSTVALSNRIDRLGMAFAKTKAFESFVDKEDRKLLGKAGLGTDEDLNRFVLIRVSLALLGLTLGLYHGAGTDLGPEGMVRLIAFLGIGFMLPKWILKSVAEAREQAFERELVAVVDVMRLLQGVGLSVDQSIEIMATQLKDLVPITGRLLHKAQVQVQSGVPWNAVLKKISLVYTSDEFRSFVQVITQIEKFGGAVQEPLKQFSERLVEKERAGAKEVMGKLTVKLTGVMVITMLPALLIVAGGPGIISIMNAFERMGG
ncbi:MAG: type II secretion system F family protein [Limnobacter sp.]|uniref:type II secretion system F family protein n=1 Tax=Limnobacter sp. TaxID=2003368 RepID=UPI00391AF7C8